MRRRPPGPPPRRSRGAARGATARRCRRARGWPSRGGRSSRGRRRGRRRRPPSRRGGDVERGEGGEGLESLGGGGEGEERGPSDATRVTAAAARPRPRANASACAWVSTVPRSKAPSSTVPSASGATTSPASAGAARRRVRKAARSPSAKSSPRPRGVSAQRPASSHALRSPARIVSAAASPRGGGGGGGVAEHRRRRRLDPLPRGVEPLPRRLAGADRGGRRRCAHDDKRVVALAPALAADERQPRAARVDGAGGDAPHDRLGLRLGEDADRRRRHAVARVQLRRARRAARAAGGRAGVELALRRGARRGEGRAGARRVAPLERAGEEGDGVEVPLRGRRLAGEEALDRLAQLGDAPLDRRRRDVHRGAHRRRQPRARREGAGVHDERQQFLELLHELRVVQICAERAHPLEPLVERHLAVGDALRVEVLEEREHRLRGDGRAVLGDGDRAVPRVVHLLEDLDEERAARRRHHVHSHRSASCAQQCEAGASDVRWNRIHLADLEVKLFSSAKKSLAARIARTLGTLHSTAAVAYNHHRRPT